MSAQKLLRKVKMLERALTPSAYAQGIMVTMWCVDRGDGKSGFARFNTKTPDQKTPLTDAEVEQLRIKRDKLSMEGMIRREY